ncbi:flagellar brake domain-containing protein [Metabacillus dongyingensis]|uniref:flagellar brake protein n=1 Tax=Metabacillus dongyingensis TaxID=2874282 RepID=UPI003B8DB94F
MCDHVLNIGDRLFLEIEDGVKLKCRVVDLLDQVLYTDYPFNEKTGKPSFLLNGTHLDAFFVGNDQNAYHFPTEVLGRFKDKIPMLAFKMPAAHEMTRIQRREYVRIETAIDIALHSVNGMFKPFVTTTIDLSAGGAAISLPPHITINQNEEVHAWLSLPFQKGTTEYAKIKAKMIRIIKSGKKDMATLQFLDLSEADRKKVLQFCFDQQLLLKKKGVLAE